MTHVRSVAKIANANGDIEKSGIIDKLSATTLMEGSPYQWVLTALFGTERGQIAVLSILS